MPVTTPQQKIKKTKIFGGENVSIQLVGDYFDDCLKAAQNFCQEQGAHFLSPFDDADVIEGQASVAVKIKRQWGSTPDHIILPVGEGCSAILALPVNLLWSNLWVEPAFGPL